MADLPHEPGPPHTETNGPAAPPAELDRPARRPRDTSMRLVRRGRHKWLRRVLVALVVLLAATMATLALRPAAIPVETAKVERGRLRVTVDEDGVTRVADRYVVAAPQSGNVSRIDLDAGDAVRAGQVLARLQPMAPPLLDARTRAEAEARVAAAKAGVQRAQAGIAQGRAAMDLAKAEADRQRFLAERGAASKQERDRAVSEERVRRADLRSAEFAARVAENDLKQAQAVLAQLTGGGGSAPALDVTAPVDGAVLKVLRESAGPVTAGEPLVELGDPSTLEIVVDVLTTDAVGIEPGSPATIERWGGEKPIPAVVRRIEPSAFMKTSALGVEEQRVNVILDVDPAERPPQLGDGFRIEARILQWERDGVVKVPTSAIFRQGTGWAVYVVEEGVAKLRTIAMGKRGEGVAEVRSGLAPDEVVVIYPSDQLVEGARVEVE